MSEQQESQVLKTDAAAIAFGQGSDARIHGEPLSANPYSSGDNIIYQSWRKGWKDCNDSWGTKPQGRRVLPLPPVRRAD